MAEYIFPWESYRILQENTYPWWGLRSDSGGPPGRTLEALQVGPWKNARPWRCSRSEPGKRQNLRELKVGLQEEAWPWGGLWSEPGEANQDRTPDIEGTQGRTLGECLTLKMLKLGPKGSQTLRELEVGTRTETSQIRPRENAQPGEFQGQIRPTLRELKVGPKRTPGLERVWGQ